MPGIVVKYVIDSREAFAKTVEQAEQVGEKVGQRLAAGVEKGMRRRKGRSGADLSALLGIDDTKGLGVLDAALVKWQKLVQLRERYSAAGSVAAEKDFRALQGQLNEQRRQYQMAQTHARMGAAKAAGYDNVFSYEADMKAARAEQRRQDAARRKADADFARISASASRSYYSRANVPTTGLREHGPTRGQFSSELRTAETLRKARQEGRASDVQYQRQAETDLRAHGQRMSDIQRATVRQMTSEQKRMWATMVRDQAAGTRAQEAITVGSINRELQRETARKNLEARKRAYGIYASETTRLGGTPLDQKAWLRRNNETYKAKKGESKGFAKTLSNAFQIQQSVEDFQYAGFRGISNNLAFMASTIGGKAGLAGVLGILAYQLFDAAKAMGVFGETTEQQKKRADDFARSVSSISAARAAGRSAGLESAMTPTDELGRLREEIGLTRQLRIAEEDKDRNQEARRRAGLLTPYDELLRLRSNASVGRSVFGTGAPGSETGRTLGLLASATPLGAPLGMMDFNSEVADKKKQEAAQFWNVIAALQKANIDTSGMMKSRTTLLGEKTVEPDYVAMDAVMEGLRKEQEQFTDNQKAEIARAKAQLDETRGRMRAEGKRYAVVRQAESDLDIAGRGGKKGDADRELQRLTEMRERVAREQAELRTKFLETHYDTEEEALAAQQEYLAGMRTQAGLLTDIVAEETRINDVLRQRSEYEQAAVALAREELQAIQHKIEATERLIETERDRIKQIDEAKYRQRSGYEGSLFDTERAATQKFIGLREKKAQETLERKRDEQLRRIDQMAPHMGSDRAAALRKNVGERYGEASKALSERAEKFAAKRDQELVDARMKMLGGQAKAAGDPERQRGLYEQMQQLMLSGVTATDDEGLAKKRFAEAQRLQSLIEQTYEKERQASQGKIAAYQAEVASLRQMEQQVIALSQQAAALRIIKDADVLAAATMNNELNAMLMKLQAMQLLKGQAPLALPDLLNPANVPAPPAGGVPPLPVPPAVPGLPTSGLPQLGLPAAGTGTGIGGIQPVVPQLAAMLAMSGAQVDSPNGIGSPGANVTNIGSLIIKTNQAGVTADQMQRSMRNYYQSMAFRAGRSQPHYPGAG